MIVNLKDVLKIEPLRSITVYELFNGMMLTLTDIKNGGNRVNDVSSLGRHVYTRADQLKEFDENDNFLFLGKGLVDLFAYTQSLYRIFDRHGLVFDIAVVFPVARKLVV